MGGLVGLAALGVAAWALALAWPGLGVAGTGAAALLVLWGLHRLLLWAEGRGWICYRKKRGSHGGLGATAEFLTMYDPSRQHLQQAARESEWKREEDDDGDRPES